MLESYRGSKWVVGVSGGPDSMCLLDMLVREHFEVVIAHVNYHIRESANRDQKIVEDYAAKYKIPIYVKEVHEKKDTGFEEWARDVRYAFYKEIIEKEKCKGVMLAHHGDDFLETAILREQQKRICYLGIRKEGMVNGVFVVRPLLSLFKSSLVDYCDENHIAYGIDETNFDTKYARNAIRADLQKYSWGEKEAMIIKYMAYNRKLLREEMKAKELVDSISANGGLDLEKMKLMDQAMVRDVLRTYITNVDDSMYDLSSNFYDDVITFILSPNSKLKEVHEYLLVKEYGMLRLIPNNFKEYTYTFKKAEEFSCPYFKVSFTGKQISDGVTLSAMDFPITIRNVKDGDSIAFKFGHKNLKKMLRSKKYPYEDVETWPVVVNKGGNVVFVVGIGADITHFSNKPSIFVVK